MRRIKGLVAVLLAVCTVFSVTGCDTVERIKERISQETVDDEKVADENKTEVSNSISVGLLDFDTFNPLFPFVFLCENNKSLLQKCIFRNYQYFLSIYRSEIR